MLKIYIFASGPLISVKLIICISKTAFWHKWFIEKMFFSVKWGLGVLHICSLTTSILRLMVKRLEISPILMSRVFMDMDHHRKEKKLFFDRLCIFFWDSVYAAFPNTIALFFLWCFLHHQWFKCISCTISLYCIIPYR